MIQIIILLIGIVAAITAYELFGYSNLLDSTACMTRKYYPNKADKQLNKSMRVVFFACFWATIAILAIGIALVDLINIYL